MMKARVIWVIIVLLFLTGIQHGMAQEGNWEEPDLEALLAAAEGEADAETLQAVQQQIAALKQQVADRDELILQMSDAIPPDGEQAALIQTLEDENRLLQERIDNLLARLTEVELERDQIRSDFDRLFDEGSFPAAVDPEAEAGAAEQQAELVASQAEVLRLQTQLAAAEGQIETLQQGLTDAEEARKELEAALVLARERQTDDSQLQEMQAALVETRAVLDRLRNSLEVSQAENAQLKKQLAAQSSGASADPAHAKDLQAQLAALRSVDVERKAAMDDLFRQLSALRSDLQARTEANEQLNEQVRAHKASLASLQKDLADRDATATALREQQQKIADSRDKAQAEAQSLRDALAACEAASAQGQELRATLETEIQAMEQEAQLQRKTLNATLTDLALVRSTLVERTEEQARHAKELERQQEQIQALERQLSDKETVVASAEQARDEALQQKRATEDVVGQLQEQITGLQELIHTRSEEQANLESELERVRLVEDRRRRTLDHTLEELAMAEKRAEDAEQKLQQALTSNAAGQGDAQEQLAALRARSAKLEQELRNMEAERSQAQADQQPANGGDVAPTDSAPGGADGQSATAQHEQAGQLQASQQETEALREQLAGLQLPDAAGSAGLQAEFEKQIAAYEETILAMEDQQQKLELLLDERERTAESNAERMEALAAELAAAQAETEALRAKMDSLQSRDIRETDLFKELEAVNAVMREKLVAVETERQRLQERADEAEALVESLQAERDEAQQRARKAGQKLEQAGAREAEYKELLSQLGPQVTQLEERVTTLMREREAMAARLLQYEEEAAALKVELEKREHRLLRAERVAEVLERARSEVEQSGRRQQRNMHYNMASVYARDGRFADAEQEYLQALQMDPNDADVHYNLGILYDDEMNRPDKAILHYRRYLQLNPHGTDADRVRSWLLRLEVDQENQG